MRNLIAALLAWFLPPRGTLPLVRPYVVHWEQHCERRLRQERRAAATLATFGVDYPYGPQGCAA